jgi:hypothetical protein
MARSTCPDCESPLRPIKLLDATETGWSDHGSQHVELSYAAPKSEGNFFTGTIPKAGTVKAKVCPDCGRILLFARPVGR